MTAVGRGRMTACPTHHHQLQDVKAKPGPDRAWQRMLSGRRLDLLDPSPMDVEIIDIAHGLARVSRWNGQTKGQHPLSVAQHSVLVERFVSQNAPKLDRKWRLAALLHDAPEYVIGDMITPFKYALGGIYRDIEIAPVRSCSYSALDCRPDFRSGGTRHQTCRPHGGLD